MLRGARWEFILEAEARAAGASSKWIATLDHEVRNYAVEFQTIIERLFYFVTSFRISPLFRAICKAHEGLNCFWSLLREEFNFECSFVGFKCADHFFSFFSVFF